jgi:predicted permease
MLLKQIEDRVNGLPGVQAASFSAFTFDEGSWNSSIRVLGVPPNHDTNVKHNVIGDAYFKTLQIPILAGRGFGPQDTATSQRVAIISEHMARTLFPAGSPIGRTYFIGSDDGVDPASQEQVIGVARDVKFADLAEPAAYIDYLPYTQRGWGFGDFEVRYSGDFSAISNEVQQAIHAIDRRLPITNITTLDEQVARSFTNQAIVAELSAFFALVAVFLSCIGLYGLMSYLVSRRTGEIGIRMALGAKPREVFRLVVGQGMTLALIGLLAGLPLALGMGRAVAGLLYGVAPNDFATFAGVAALLGSVALVACYIPARRAMRVDPLVALRYE